MVDVSFEKKEWKDSRYTHKRVSKYSVEFVIQGIVR